MAEPKTKPTRESVTKFIDAVENDVRRADAKVVLKMMKDITGEKPVMWGPTIVGFGSYKTPTGDWPVSGFSPRKANMVVYIMPGFKGYEGLLKKLGKHKTGVSCLYINKLADVDQSVLREIVEQSLAAMRAKHG